MKNIKTLIVEDDKGMGRLMEELLQARGYKVTVCAAGEEALELYRTSPFPLLIVDWSLPKMDGLQLCREIRALPRGDLSVILVVTGRNQPEDILQVLDAGADDYMDKPMDLQVFEQHLNVRLTIAERRVLAQTSLFLAREKIALLEEQTKGRHAFEGMIGKSDPMQNVFRSIRLAAESDVTVLLSGESGTGKELAARAIHSVSERSNKPFMAVNCSAIPETLLESELFGHVKGSFTGAVRDKPGLFPAADGGTLFLDEIGDVSPAIQVKLLRTLQEREIRRVGDEQQIKIDVRLVTATNRNLQHLVSSGAVREDFYYRIRVFEIHIPPIRDRKEDIPLLIEHYISEFSRARQKPIQGIEKDALRKMLDYPWPGNVRELRSAIEHAFVTASSDRITLDNLPAEIRLPRAPAQPPISARPGRTDEESEKTMIIEALRATGGNRTKAAKLLGVSRVTLWSKIRVHRIQVKGGSNAR
ncbi:MAG: hypothetical protein A3G34_16855 [Candidatus Lindowbacteria bacterium RIFCSPLOWO2_12_FULL_62_27]|nr:MAG: hypothetical protein A3I06_05300 [Candidatus Lindowbacteria bacterium RIFCSPLOWO2_02_FULL_62_12]OGH62898.1 MAG: hypothetical protein A3G34_16855 [Candidatus Lindowbacteria bacterium RIFCSPLOWO2_12_FULL_62_27]